MLIRNLAGIFTGKGFVENEGRRPTAAQADFVRGPVDIYSENGVIVEIGPHLTVPSDCEMTDGAGHVALPGFVDSHTHAIFAGNRAPEFFHRWAGQSYVEIAQSGGGIKSTQGWTAEATDESLVHSLVARLRDMLNSGVVAVEVKSGYGRSAKEEIRLLRLIQEAGKLVQELTVVPTFLGLHALPTERSETEFTDEMIAALPEISRQGLAQFSDSFPEQGFFTLEESLRFAEASEAMGLRAKVHADELSNLGTSLAFIQNGAVSIDHLQHIDSDAVKALASAETVATLLPATSFFLGLPYANARRLIDEGAKVALATDFNPGTAPQFDLGFTALLGAANLKMRSAEILCGITFNGAQALGLGASHGSLSVGRNSRTNLVEVGGISSIKPQELLDRWVLSGSCLKFSRLTE